MKTLLDVVGMLAKAALIGPILSFLLEYVGAFQNMSAKAKYWVTLAICVGLPVVAVVLLQVVPASWWVVAEPYWQAVAAGFAIWLASQFAHNAYKSYVVRGDLSEQERVSLVKRDRIDAINQARTTAEQEPANK